MIITAKYVDNNGIEWIYDIMGTDPYLTIDRIDTSKAVEQAIVFKFEYLEGNVAETSAIVVVRDVTSIDLVPGSIVTTVNVSNTPGDKLDTSEASFVINFSDGTYIYAGLKENLNPNLYVGEVDITTEGTKYLVVRFLDKEVKFEIQVKSYSTSGKIYGASLPGALISRDSYKKNFTVGDNVYVVGDDNPYYFYLDLLKLNGVDLELIDGKGTKYVVNIYLGSEAKASALLTGTARDQYVSVDYVNNAYQFTSDAVGKTFTIEIWPEDESTYDVDKSVLTRTHTVMIVDAYNVYDEKELNLITNLDTDLNETGPGNISQVEAVNNFLSRHGITKVDIAGVVLHRNMTITTEHLPEEYLIDYIHPKTGVAEKGFYDQIAIYNHQPTAENLNFTLWGNYYSVFSYSLPCIVPKGIANNTDDHSSSSLFKFNARTVFYNGSGIAEKLGYTSMLDHRNEDFTATIVDTAFRDNDPNSNDQSASERHMRGLACLKVTLQDLDVLNTNIDAFYQSTVVDGDDATLTIDNSKLYNAWQGHIFVWNVNILQDDAGGKDQRETYATYDPTRINITNSLVAKCGGPVILCQQDRKNEEFSYYSGTYVTADSKSKIESNVTGQEAWFVAVGQTAMAADIKALNGLITGFSAGYATSQDLINLATYVLGVPAPQNASFTTTGKIQGVETINMRMVVMGTMPGQAGNFIGKLTIDGKVVLDTTAENTRVKSYMNAIDTGFGAMPIFESSGGGVCYYNATTQNPAEMLQSLASDAHTSAFGPYLPSATQPDVNCFDGDYINVYVNGIALNFDYYH